MRSKIVAEVSIPAEGKHTHYDRVTKQIAAYYNGQIVGYYRNESEAHEVLDDIAYQALTHNQPIADVVEDYRDELATDADIAAFVAEWNASADAEHDAVLDYADGWNAAARQRVPADVVLLPGDLVIINMVRAIEGAWVRKAAA